MLLVTYGCNLHCVYCYEPKQVQKQMSFDMAKKSLLRQIQTLGNDYTEFDVQFMGGEPMMVFPLLKSISEWLWQQHFNQKLRQIFAVTNGTLIDETNIAWLEQNKDRFCLGLSFDGNRLMQDLNRSSSAARVKLDFFAKLWPNQTVKLTISPQTLSTLSDGVKFLHEAGFSSITADLAMGKHVTWDKEHLKVLNTQLHLLMEYYLANPNLHPFSMLDICIDDVMMPNRLRQKNCSCGEDLVCIDCDGIEYACHLFSPVTISVEEAREVKAHVDFHDHASFISPTCEKCLLHSICTICPGMNYICNHDISKQSTFTCQSFKVIFFANCEYRLLLAERDKNVAMRKRIEKIVKLIVK